MPDAKIRKSGAGMRYRPATGMGGIALYGSTKMRHGRARGITFGLW